MHKHSYIAAGAGLLVATTGPVRCGRCGQRRTASPVVGYTYVDDNTAVRQYHRRVRPSRRRLAQPDPGFTVPGRGRRAGLGSGVPGCDTGNRDGRYLLAVDAGSNQISVLRITAGGVPVLVGQPVPSGGVTPVSVAVSWTGLVYVANQGAGGSGYSGFRLHFDGSLTPVPGSTVTVPDGSGVGDVFFNAFGNVLIGTRTGTSQIDSFVVLPGGRLLQAPGSPFTGQGLGQLGAEFSPTRPWQLFVSNAHNGTGLGTVSAYNDFFGHLSPIGPSPYADGQTAPCWVEISHDGRYLFTVNTGSGQHFQLFHKPGRLARPAREHDYQLGRRRHRRPAVPGRQVPAGRWRWATISCPFSP